MKRGILIRVGLGVVAMFWLAWLPQVALAQHGGGHGGGGGGFHGGGGGGFHGGGGGGFHGGGGFSGGGGHAFVGGHSFGGGYRGGYGGRGFSGGRGGYGWGGRGYGWGGRGWGRGYGYGWGGWGWGFGFGWPYWGWGGYPYGYYGYYPGYYAPYPYYSDPSNGYSDDYIGDYPPNPSDYNDGRNYNNRRNYSPNRGPQYNNGNGNRPAADPSVQPQQLNPNEPAGSGRPAAPGGAANMSHNDGTAENFVPRPPVRSVDPMMATPSSYRYPQSNANRANLDRHTSQTGASLRPEMQRALERLHNMPPFAREREIEAGRYRQFSPEDKQILRNGE